MKRPALRFVVTTLLFGIASSLVMFLVAPLLLTLIIGRYGSDIGCLLIGLAAVFAMTAVMCSKKILTARHILLCPLAVSVFGLLLVWVTRLLGVSDFWRSISSPLKNAFDWWIDVPALLVLSVLILAVMVIALLTVSLLHSISDKEQSGKIMTSTRRIIDTGIYFALCAVLLFVICPTVFWRFDVSVEGLITGLVLLTIFAFIFALCRDVNILQLLICSFLLFGASVLLYRLGEITQNDLLYSCAKTHGIGYVMLNFTGMSLPTSKIIGDAAFVAVLWFVALCIGTALRRLIPKRSK